nr:hypothetical protein GCM10020241_10280 [Streptoalloteichus tenebrarius]
MSETDTADGAADAGEPGRADEEAEPGDDDADVVVGVVAGPANSAPCLDEQAVASSARNGTSVRHLITPAA